MLKSGGAGQLVGSWPGVNGLDCRGACVTGHSTSSIVQLAAATKSAKNGSEYIESGKRRPCVSHPSPSTSERGTSTELSCAVTRSSRSSVVSEPICLAARALMASVPGGKFLSAGVREMNAVIASGAAPCPLISPHERDANVIRPLRHTHTTRVANVDHKARAERLHPYSHRRKGWGTIFSHVYKHLGHAQTRDRRTWGVPQRRVSLRAPFHLAGGHCRCPRDQSFWGRAGAILLADEVHTPTRVRALTPLIFRTPCPGIRKNLGWDMYSYEEE